MEGWMEGWRVGGLGWLIGGLVGGLEGWRVGLVDWRVGWLERFDGLEGLDGGDIKIHWRGL